jgi:hypothetical protein
MWITILYTIWIAYTAGTLAFFLGVLGLGWIGSKDNKGHPFKKSKD